MIENILRSRGYLKPGEDWGDACGRVNEAMTGNRSGQFFDLLYHKRVLPNTPAWINAGGNNIFTACMVLPIEDSIDSIYRTLGLAAEAQKLGIGTGFNFSNIRAEGEKVSAGGVAGGPLGFLQVYNTSAEVMRQGGVRSGANMAILNQDHPDILSFICEKARVGGLSAFNLSVGVTDFAELQDDINWFDICAAARDIGCPGLIFLDRLGGVDAVNPCGEAPLPPYGVCLLASVNLMTIDGMVELRNIVEDTVYMLDEAIDRGSYICEESRKIAQRDRRIGIGVMGFHDYLVSKGIKYSSTGAVDVASKIAYTMRLAADCVNRDLGVDRGYTLCQAPTGTLARIAGVSHGIEPIFARRIVSYVGGEEIVTEYPEEYETAHEIDPIQHVRIQAAFQRYFDGAVSKTVNLPRTATIEDVADVFRAAYRLGCKGITVYRDGSHEDQPIRSCPTGGCD